MLNLQHELKRFLLCTILPNCRHFNRLLLSFYKKNIYLCTRVDATITQISVLSTTPLEVAAPFCDNWYFSPLVKYMAQYTRKRSLILFAQRTRMFNWIFSIISLSVHLALAMCTFTLIRYSQKVRKMHERTLVKIELVRLICSHVSDSSYK